MNTDRKRQTTLRVKDSRIPAWHLFLQKMQECKSPDALVSLHGQPHHKVQQPGFEIWHYPLGVESGMQYSIHISVWPDRSMQMFLYFEPINSDFPKRRWWQFWKRKHERITTRAV
jgi:hypothetical protein